MVTTNLLVVFKIVVHCELYLCNINRLDVPEEDHLIWISQSTEYSNDMSLKDRNDRGLNTRPYNNGSNTLPLSYDEVR